MNNENAARFPVQTHKTRAHSTFSGVFSTERQTGYTPMQLKYAYRSDSRFTGSGIKVSVIAALDNVALNDNLSVFSRQFGLPEAKINVYYPDGRAEDTSDEWLLESSLDTQWIHAFAPDAEISAVFAKNSDVESMLSAARYACKTLMADVVLMCFGTEESASDEGLSDFMQSSECIFVASSGDTGGVTSFPSTSPYCISIGGTRLTFGSDGMRVVTRSAWHDGGGGISDIFALPEWQRRFHGIAQQSGNMRATPDLSMIANTSVGASVYCASLGGWTTAGGTSLAAALFAGVCACIRQAHGEIAGSSDMAEFLYNKAGGTGYAVPQYSFFDVTTGMSGDNRASVGFDLATGLGEPVIAQLLL